MKNTISPFSNSKLSLFLESKDYTVSRETFLLLKDSELEMLITFPKPKIEDLKKYYESEDYISHTDSKKSIIDRVYQTAKNYTIKKKIKLVNRLFNQINLKQENKDQKPKTILDIGCGTGDFLVACKSNNWSVTGVEPNQKARILLKSKLDRLKPNSKNFNRPKITTLISELDEIEFDVITMWHVLEHVPNLEEYIVQLKKLLKKNGILIIAVPNHKSYDAHYYGKFWAAYDVPRHLWHFSQKSIKLLFEKQKMKIVKIIPMKLDSFYVSLLSEKYKKGNLRSIKAFFIGLKSNLKAKSSNEYSSLTYIIKNK
ncbi:MAG: class I SAM-dependent methyltransferase [Flavobacteriaceae bacterium]|nr:class I SAM-dependent methyltransferase [Flavobacteriaceae bacterium]